MVRFGVELAACRGMRIAPRSAALGGTRKFSLAIWKLVVEQF
jgi:hypothetical protein